MFLFPSSEAWFAPFDLLNEAATSSKLLQGRGFLWVLVSWVLHRGMAHRPLGLGLLLVFA